MTLAVVSVSGGKDSTATALLAIDRMGPENCRFVFADTGNEHDQTYDYVRNYLPTVLGRPVDEVKADFAAKIEGKRKYIQEKWAGKGVPSEFITNALTVLKPTGVPFLDLCLWKGRFPSRMAQFCTQELKRYPLDEYLFGLMGQGFGVENWRGIRRDESRNRADALEREDTPEGFTIVRPIATWTAKQTIDYVVSKGVKHNPLYFQGMGRVGCMPCINCRKDELSEIARRFPEHIDKIREWERLVSLAAKRGWTTFFAGAKKESMTPRDGWILELRDKDKDGNTVAEYIIYVEPPEEIGERYRIDKMVEWSHTLRGGVKYDLFKAAPIFPACSSSYGLCE